MKLHSGQQAEMALVPVAGQLYDSNEVPVRVGDYLLELIPGRLAGLHYEGEPYWMERLCVAGEEDGTGHSTGVWYCLAPDMDFYAEVRARG